MFNTRSLVQKRFLLMSVGIILSAALAIVWLYLPEPYQTLYPVSTKHLPDLVDDETRDSLLTCAEKQLHYLKTKDLSNKLSFNGNQVPVSLLIRSIEVFIKKLKEDPDQQELETFLKQNYQFYQSGGREKGKRKEMLVTGYYEPIFPASLKRQGRYQYPIYKVPKTLITRVGTDEKKLTGRLDSAGDFVPFWTRQQIETASPLKGDELAFLSDPFDAFLLHVQGSGKLRFENGTTHTIRPVRFAGSNGLQYNSIGKLLVDRGIFSLSEISIPVIRDYLSSHPEEQQEILHHNPRFIFFSLGPEEIDESRQTGPQGSSGEELTPGRSIAIDPHTLPPGPICYLTSQRPSTDADGKVIGWQAFSRLVFPQDSGAAIRGAGRVDLFWGNGQYAEQAAYHMKETGRLYFLLLKKVR